MEILEGIRNTISSFRKHAKPSQPNRLRAKQKERKAHHLIATENGINLNLLG
jgi:hypothetical protein